MVIGVSEPFTYISVSFCVAIIIGYSLLSAPYPLTKTYSLPKTFSGIIWSIAQSWPPDVDEE